MMFFEILLATCATKSVKSIGALELAPSEITRMVIKGMLNSKQTCATAAPSISTQNKSGKCLIRFSRVISFEIN